MPTPTGSATATTTASIRGRRPWTRPWSAAGPRSASSGSNPERLDELTALAADGALPLRVDAYLALNSGNDFLGDWYTSREPGSVDDHLRVQGLKIHLDDGGGNKVLWERADLARTIARAVAAGWQVSVHTMSSVAMDLILDAFEATLGPAGPNPLRHRIDHAVQVTDEQVARLVAMEIPLVIHLDGATDWVLDEGLLDQLDRDSPGEEAIIDAAPLVGALPFARARLLLVRGQIERRSNRRLAARASLSTALSMFEELGSPPWAARARADTGRLGLRHRHPNELTATEQRIAELAAGGRTNRQVAEAAFVSPKTVAAGRHPARGCGGHAPTRYCAEEWYRIPDSNR